MVYAKSNAVLICHALIENSREFVDCLRIFSSCWAADLFKACAFSMLSKAMTTIGW